MIPHGLFCLCSSEAFSAAMTAFFVFCINKSDKTFSVAYAPLCVSGIKRTFVFQEGLCLDTRQPHAYTLCLLFVQLIHHAPKLAPANLQDDRL